MAVPAHKTEYFIIENSNLQKKANTALQSPTCECRLRHLSSQQVQSSHTITVDRMAHPARFERAIFRLGGERSILLSYGRIL